MKTTDKKLVQAYRRGEQDAFAELVKRHGTGLLGYLLKVTDDRQTAEDIFQETFLKVHHKADKLKTENFKSWLYKIATNLVIDRHRASARLRTAELHTAVCGDDSTADIYDLVADKAPGPGEAVAAVETAQAVRQALAALPPRQKMTLVLAYYQQLSYRQVAEIMDCSVGTVKAQMFKALKKLATILPHPEEDVL